MQLRHHAFSHLYVMQLNASFHHSQQYTQFLSKANNFQLLSTEKDFECSTYEVLRQRIILSICFKRLCVSKLHHRENLVCAAKGAELDPSSEEKIPQPAGSPYLRHASVHPLISRQGSALPVSTCHRQISGTWLGSPERRSN